MGSEWAERMSCFLCSISLKIFAIKLFGLDELVKVDGDEAHDEDEDDIDDEDTEVSNDEFDTELVAAAAALLETSIDKSLLISVSFGLNFLNLTRPTARHLLYRHDPQELYFRSQFRAQPNTRLCFLLNRSKNCWQLLHTLAILVVVTTTPPGV